MSALVGDFQPGVQYLWPQAAITIADVMDMPSWERPTDDTGYTPPVADDTFDGSPGFEGGGTYTGAPGFTGDPFASSSWTPGSGGGDGGTITVVDITGGVISLNITANRYRFYTIEVYDMDGDRVTAIPGWIRGRLRRVLDKASELNFTIPYDAEGAADLVRPNTVWLRDRWGFVIDTFQIQRRRPTGTGDASYYEIECVGAVAQLGDDLVLEYNAESTTVLAHVTALMELQQRSNPLALGDINSEIADVELPFYAVDTNIHAALLSLQVALPRDLRGRFYVDARRRLQWRLVVGDDTEQVITRAANVASIEAETDYTSLVNRIYMYGEGQDAATRLRLTDAGEAEEYLDDAASISTWGLCPAMKLDRRIRYPETLLRVAERILEEFAEPPVVVSVELLDLAKADDAPDGWADIDIGGRYRVVDTALAIDTSVEIVGIETDLARPVPVRVELANQTRSLGDLISGLVDALQQPLDVDGDRYPTMGRNYTDREARSPRAGDTRWNTDRGQMYDGDSWEDMGGGEELHYVEATKAELPSAGSVDVRSMGRVDGSGSDNGMVCVPNPDATGWDALNFWE